MVDLRTDETRRQTTEIAAETVSCAAAAAALPAGRDCRRHIKMDNTAVRSGTMQLLLVYTVIVVIAETIAAGLGELVEFVFPSIGLIVFMALFLAALWAAWLLSVRLTETRRPDLQAFLTQRPWSSACQ
jgi:uncharacterized membrane protein YdbT with pleckstrin-like domain